jgi:hypothetical protein
MRRKRVYEVCMYECIIDCVYSRTAGNARQIFASALFHTDKQASTIVKFGELGVRGALGFILLTCTFDASDIVRLIKNLQIIHVARLVFNVLALEVEWKKCLHSIHWPPWQHRQKREVEDRLGRGLHLPVVVRALPVRSCVDSFVEQCDLPRATPTFPFVIGLYYSCQVASAA